VSPVTDPFPPAPPTASVDRMRAAVARRTRTDYVFHFWTALGWIVLSCGLYSFYVFYRLMWRSVEHNRRRLELLDATTAWAWERAQAQGRDAELTPAFQRIGAHLGVLRRISGEFRDPGIWLVLMIISSSLAQLVGYVLLDGDLVDHEAAERGIEHELAGILGVLGAPVSSPSPPTKGRHSWPLRVLALLASCGLYGLWWLADVMRDANEHYRGDWWFEDQLPGAVDGLR
jgi:hypothetical protein